jgi:hypothetical protein
MIVFERHVYSLEEFSKNFKKIVKSKKTCGFFGKIFSEKIFSKKINE